MCKHCASMCNHMLDGGQEDGCTETLNPCLHVPISSPLLPLLA